MRNKPWYAVGAVAMVAVALTTVGAAGASTTLASRAAGSADDAVYDLMSYVPTGHRYSCVEITVNATNTMPLVVAEANAVSAAVNCYDDTVSGVTYYQFSDSAAMNRVYLAAVSQLDTGAAGAAGDDDCPENGTWGFNSGNDGRIICYLGTLRAGAAIAGTAVRLWTEDRNDILAIAVLPEGDGDFAKLRTWWIDEAGPLKDADDDGFVSEVDADDEEDLLGSIPKATRTSCEVTDRDDALTNAAERLIVAAAVLCERPADGIDPVFYYKIDPDVIDDYLASPARSASQEELDAADDDARCPTYGSWSLGTGKAKHKVGTYACYFTESPTGDYPVLVWSDTKQGILGSATGTDEDPTRLNAWWESDDSGPIQR